MSRWVEGPGYRLWEGDCRVVMADLLGMAPALVLTDPPYGVGEPTDRATRGRGQLTDSLDFPAIYGDDAPFDPTHLLAFPRLVLFGANHYAAQLPPSPSWLVWDKLDGLSTPKRALGFDDNGDAELAWTNLGGPVRILSHRWKGMLKDSEKDEVRVHPTQKPVALMARIIELFTQPGDLVVDPYMGSGPTGVAAMRLGRRFVGCEIHPTYFAIAERRIAQAAAQLRLPLGGL